MATDYNGRFFYYIPLHSAAAVAAVDAWEEAFWDDGFEEGDYDDGEPID